MNESERRQLHESSLDQQRESRAEYMPTPDQIAAACLEINSTWSEFEKAKRRGVRLDDCDRWDVPLVREGE